MELYRTIKKESSQSQTIEKSRFIAHAKPADTRQEAEDFITAIKGRYKDATHNVPAMVIGSGSQIQWASDDGEPQGTSGAPIVQMLVSEGLTNIVVVVTRYFGGIKLGTGGLVRAYTSSTKLAVEAAGVCSALEICRIKIQVEYTFLSKIQQLSKNKISISEKNDFVIENIDYGEKVLIEIITPVETETGILDLLGNLTSGSAEVISKVYGTEKV